MSLILVGLFKKIDYNKKITDIPSISGINSIPNFNNLVKKAEYDAKISDIEKNILI